VQLAIDRSAFERAHNSIGGDPNLDLWPSSATSGAQEWPQSEMMQIFLFLLREKKEELAKLLLAGKLV